MKDIFASYSTKSAPWQLSSASARGKGHVDHNLKNQDAVAYSQSATGNIICAVVSDGAGTAARSDEGSDLAAKSISSHMERAAANFRADLNLESQAKLEFINAIKNVRRQLEGQGVDIRLFHCTMVAWLYTPIGSFIAQIGDSAAISTRIQWVTDNSERAIDYFPDGSHVLHEVERGEYANETSFLTEPEWQQHLRISTLPSEIDAIVLMTDGAMDIATTGGRVFRGFLSNLLGKLSQTNEAEQRDAIIHDWLNDRKTYSVTADDKTLFVAIKTQWTRFPGAPIYLAPPISNGAARVPLQPRSTPISALPITSSRKAQPVASGSHPSAQPEPSRQIANPIDNHAMHPEPVRKKSLIPHLTSLLLAVATVSGILYFFQSDLTKLIKGKGQESGSDRGTAGVVVQTAQIPASTVIPMDPPKPASPQQAPTLPTVGQTQVSTVIGSNPGGLFLPVTSFPVNKDLTTISVRYPNIQSGTQILSIKPSDSNLVIDESQSSCKRDANLESFDADCNLVVKRNRSLAPGHHAILINFGTKEKGKSKVESAELYPVANNK